MALLPQSTTPEVNLEEEYRDITEWYSSRTTVNDTSSFKLLALALLFLASPSNMRDTF